MKFSDLAIQAALEAGQAILKIYEQDFEVEFKADDSPLTAADKASHNVIVQALEATPYPVLSEESTAVAYEERKTWNTYWLVDPLDGTKEFVKKNGEFTVNIALVESGIPVFGVVYVPVEETLYVGEDRKAWKVTGCEGKTPEELRLSAAACRVSGSPAKPLRVVASKSHCNDETRAFIASLEAEYGEVELVSRGSSLKLCLVAEGRADLYPRIAPTMEWDTAAAHAVISAAGGRVFKYRSDIAATDYKVGTSALNDLPYNKQDLLNAYFVVSGLHE